MKPILRKVDSGYNYSFSVREDIFPFLYNRWHYHPEVELTLIRKGTGIRLVGDSMEQFTDGDLILLGSNLPHLWRNDEVYFAKDSTLWVEAVAIHFKEEFWGRPFLELPELKPVAELLNVAKRGLKITGKLKDQITDLMEAIHQSKDLKRVELLINMLGTIATEREYEFLASPAFTGSYALNNTDRINEIYDYTLNNFRKKICIKEAAGAANISPNSFCRYFKSRTFKTYWQFLAEIRIGYACKLLIENQSGVSQICYECGFNNLSNFNRYFKIIKKKTPLQYAKEYLKGRDKNYAMFNAYAAGN